MTRHSARNARKKDYKKGLDPLADGARRQEETEKIRKEERERSFAVKRRQIGIVPIVESDASSETLSPPYTVAEIEEAVIALRSTTLKAVVARGGSAASPTDAANWQLLKPSLPPLHLSPFASSSSDGAVAICAAAIPPLACLRASLGYLSPPVTEVVSAGGLDHLCILFDLICEVLMATHYGAKAAPEVESALQEVLVCLGNIAGADEEDHSAQAETLFPMLPRIFTLCAEGIASSPSTCGNSSHPSCSLSNPYETCRAAVTLLGNFAADYPRIVVERTHATTGVGSELRQSGGEGVSQSAERPAAVPQWERPHAVLETATLLLNVCTNEIVKSKPFEAAQAQDAVQKHINMGHTLVWLFCNSLRACDPSLISIFLFPPPVASAPAGLYFNAILPLSRIVNYCSIASQPGSICDVLQLPVDNELRIMLGESLWCLTYCFSAIPKLFTQLYFLPPGWPSNESPLSTASEIIIAALVTLISSVCHQPPQSSGDPSLKPATTDTTPRTLYAVDVLTPALSLLTFAAVSSTQINAPAPADASPPPSTSAADLIISHPRDFHRVLSSLLTHSHRGVLRGSSEFAAVLASGQLQHTTFVLDHLPRLLELMQAPLAFDIKREVAISLVHLSFNHGCKYLPNVMNATPSVVDAFLGMFSSCRFDKTAISVGLEFVEGVLRCWPNGRRMLYEKNGIEIIESAQHLHGDEIFHRISDIICRYFDDLDGDVLDEHAEDHFDSEAQLSAQMSITPIDTPKGEDSAEV